MSIAAAAAARGDKLHYATRARVWAEAASAADTVRAAIDAFGSARVPLLGGEHDVPVLV